MAGSKYRFSIETVVWLARGHARQIQRVVVVTLWSPSFECNKPIDYATRGTAQQKRAHFEQNWLFHFDRMLTLAILVHYLHTFGSRARFEVSLLSRTPLALQRNADFRRSDHFTSTERSLFIESAWLLIRAQHTLRKQVGESAKNEGARVVVRTELEITDPGGGKGQR